MNEKANYKLFCTVDYVLLQYFTGLYKVLIRIFIC